MVSPIRTCIRENLVKGERKSNESSSCSCIVLLISFPRRRSFGVPFGLEQKGSSFAKVGASTESGSSCTAFDSYLI